MIEIQEFQLGTNHFQALIQNLADLVTVHDSNGVIRFATPSTAKELGYREHELIGRNAFELIHPDDIPVVRTAFTNVIQGTNRGKPTEYRVRCADGKWLSVETVGTNFLNDPVIHGIILTSRNVSERKRHEEERLAITEVASALRTALTRADMLPIILDQLIHLLSLDGAALVTCDAPAGQIAIELGRGRCESLTGLAIQRGAGLLGRVMESGEIYHSDDARSDPLYQGSALRSSLNEDPLAAACLPLKAQDETIGALWVERVSAGAGRPAEIREDELSLLGAIADMAANAIHRATLYEQTQLRLHRLTALQTIDLAISGSVDLDVTLQLLLGEVTSRLRIDAADVLVVDRQAAVLRYAASRGFMTAFMARPQLQLGQELARRALLERKTMHVPDLSKLQLSAETQKIVNAEGFVTYYGVPLIASGRIVGVLELFQRTSLPTDAEWTNYLDGLATHVAFAIEKVSLIQDLQRSNETLMKAYDGVIEGWSRALALRDHETQGHTERVADMTVRLARLLGVDSERLVHIRRGAMLHDIGKIALPDSILLKAEPLTPQEWDVLRRHPTHAYELMSSIDYLTPALDIPYCHHERWDGTGYPRGLKEQEIPVAAQIFSIVDVYDALTSDRPYRPAWDRPRAEQHIRQESGAAFNPVFVNTFLENLPALLPLAA